MAKSGLPPAVAACNGSDLLNQGTSLQTAGQGVFANADSQGGLAAIGADQSADCVGLFITQFIHHAAQSIRVGADSDKR